VTGNGLKTPDARLLGLADEPARSGRPGLAPILPPSFDACDKVARRMTAIRIPPVLRTATGGVKHVEIEGSTVREVIDLLVAAYPATAGQLQRPDGELNAFINVFVNGTDVRHLRPSTRR
jgi:molybdopterin synthase sulfur carrier subunit